MAQEVMMLAAKSEVVVNPWDQHDGRRELIPESCPLTSPGTPWHVHTHK